MFKRKKEAEKIIELSNRFHQVFDSEEGLYVLAELARRSYMLEPVTDIQSKENTAYNDGKRGLFLEILRILNYDTNQAINFLKGLENE